MRRFPDALSFLFLCLVAAAALTWIVPAGEYDRRDNPATHRQVVVPNTYHYVQASPVRPFAALVAIPRGFADAIDVIAFVLLVGAGITVIDKTGALGAGVDALIRSLGNREAWIVPIVCLLFAAGGVLEGMMEEIIPLVPVMLLVSSRLGYPPVAAVAMSLLAAAVGGAFSPINPFQVGIAQKLAGLPLLSGWGVRLAFLVPALALSIWWTMRASRASQRAELPGSVDRSPQLARRAALHGAPSAAQDHREFTPRMALLFALVVVAFAVYVVGVIAFDWDFDQMAALFVLLGLVAGAVGGLGVKGTSDAFVEGVRGMAFAALVIGMARAIYVVLNDGHVIDTIVYAMFVPVSHLPSVGAAVGMMAAQVLLHVPVPSTSGQAVLSMPILVPLSDLLGLSAQVTVLAYQYGAGLCEIVTPTNGAMMAILVAAGVSFEEWIRFVAPLFAMLLALGAVALAVAVMLHVM
jgi:uncharacterized ion transporter superfamily protein YfcC